MIVKSAMITMDNRARSFVMLMMIIAVFSFLLRTVIERIIKINIIQNESGAQATLKLISTALENYSQDNQGVFPASLSLLTQTHPSYLDKDYVAQSPIKGYNYSCLRLEPSGYSCQAIPVKCKITGKIIYTITTAGALVSEECGKKE